MIFDGISLSEWDWNEVAGYLDDTLALFEDGAKWGKNSYHDSRTGCYCLMGGLLRASDSSPEVPHAAYRDFDARRRALSYPGEALIQMAVKDEFPHRDGSVDSPSVIGFNDHFRTTWPEVKTVIETAAAKARELATEQRAGLEAT